MAPAAIIDTPIAALPEAVKSSTEGLSKNTPSSCDHFDPKKHLAFRPPPNILNMQDLGLEPTALSPVATTEPFPLLSHAAVLAHRRELFSPAVLDNCLHHTRPGSVQLRGMAPRYAPFLHEFWTSPELLCIVSGIAGVELVPAMDYEISHTNVQLGPGGLDAVRDTPVEPPEATAEAVQAFEADKSAAQAVTDQSNPIIEWHKDSHPWVCVVMLSDARYMTGGETELLKGDGSTIKAKAPQMGCAVLLQGRYITHIAAPVRNMPERVTIVTSFRPKNPLLPDETTNANVRNKSHLTELYYQWTVYRLDVMAQRAQIAADALRRKYAENVRQSDPEGKPGSCRVETVNVNEVNSWAEDMIKYIRETTHEMRPLDSNGR